MKEHEIIVPEHTEYVTDEGEVGFLETEVTLRVTNDNLITLLSSKSGYNTFGEPAYTEIILDDGSHMNIRVNEIIFHPGEQEKNTPKSNDDVYLDEGTNVIANPGDGSLYQYSLDSVICPKIDMPYSELIKKMDNKVPSARRYDLNQSDGTVLHIDVSDLRLVN